MTFSNEKLNVILNNILKNDSLSYSVIGKYIIISKSIPQPSVLKIDSLPEKELKFISGIITDDESKESLPFATIALKNKGKGTVANSNGEFVLKIPRDCLSDTLFVSYLGYVGREIPVEQAIGNNFTIAMRKEFISIPEIIIRTKIPQEIIYKTFAAIPHNYGTTPSLLTGCQA
jgi:hypothetical protein